MSEEKLGVKETKELLVGVIDVSVLLIKHLKDGVQLGKDASAVLAEVASNEVLKASLLSAVEGISKVPAEVKDVDLLEGGELAVLVASKIKDILAALKSEVPA